MNELNIFEYVYHDSPLCRMNPGIKLTFLIIFCITSGILPPLLLLLPSAALLPLIFTSGSAVRKQFTLIWKIYIFFIISGVIKFLTSGSVIEAAGFSMRMLLMMSAGMLFYSSTKLSELRRVFKGRPAAIPFIDFTRAGDLIVMTMAFLPLVFKTINELRQSRYSRCFKPGRNIFRTIRINAVPLMISMFIKTDEMADAWYSRCYNPSEK